ncbi:hypothetical protein PPSIR1_07148 [Plesiocystis pacifica SIR-1]|uniref:Lipoprotein n=1 Tax=Plesiocystis pacifica SIR-1 TaxID=391625 RepID=A6G588_9BACT|nr:hypothetical protein [Plesiocystis pacifica]EDM79000.1 hypothetical protein PPSIR1_07148 [Plesiocystis pacifica SIR-1]
MRSKIERLGLSLAVLAVTLTGCERDLEATAEIVGYGPSSVTIELHAPEGSVVPYAGMLGASDDAMVRARTDASGVARFEQSLEGYYPETRALNLHVARSSTLTNASAFIELTLDYEAGVIQQLPEDGAAVLSDQTGTLDTNGDVEVTVATTTGDRVAVAGASIEVDAHGIGSGSVNLLSALAALRGDPSEVEAELLAFDGDAQVYAGTSTFELSEDGLDPFLQRWLEDPPTAQVEASPGILWRPFRPEHTSPKGLAAAASDATSKGRPRARAFITVGDPPRWTTRWVAREETQAVEVRRCYGPAIYGVTRTVTVHDVVRDAVVAERTFEYSRREAKRCKPAGVVVNTNRADIYVRAADEDVEAWLAGLLSEESP